MLTFLCALVHSHGETLSSDDERNAIMATVAANEEMFVFGTVCRALLCCENRQTMQQMHVGLMTSQNLVMLTSDVLLTT